MFEQLILGLIQGIAEWLPVSSEGLLVLIKTKFFSDQAMLCSSIQQALFLHLGTFFAALVYFFSDIKHLIKALWNYKNEDKETKKLLSFLIVATAISAVIGSGLLKMVFVYEAQLQIPGKIISLIIGLFLLITALVALRFHKEGKRNIVDLKIKDMLLLGLVQGLAVFPGVSRSGITVSSLLLRKFDKTAALRLSFLMSLPIVFVGSILLNLDNFVFEPIFLVGVFSSFVFGLMTIHILLKLAQRINFGLFMMVFGFLAILAAFI